MKAEFEFQWGTLQGYLRSGNKKRLHLTTSPPPKKKTNKQPLLLTRIRPGRDVNDSFVFYESEEDKALTKTMKKTKKKEKKKKNDVRQ